MSDPRPPRRGFFQLITELPDLVRELVAREIELLKTELIGKVKQLGIGVGLIAAALVFVFAFLGVLLTAAIFALSLIMPGWAAALIVAGVLLLIAVILALIGYRRIVSMGSPVPSETIDSLQRDLRAIKGIGKRGTS